MMAVIFSFCCKLMVIMPTLMVKARNVPLLHSCFKLGMVPLIIIWVAVRNIQPRAQIRPAKVMKLTLCTFQLEMLFPGRLYGGNPTDNRDGNGGDRFGHLVDLYAWNPHCRYLDGTGPSGSVNDSSAQNDWKGAWWHSSFTVHSGFVKDENPYAENGKKGTYFFEFSRPLRTMDHLQQDVQFTIGGTSKMSVGFWYPVDGKPWRGSGHYSVNCDWAPIDISQSSSLSGKSVETASSSSWNFASAFSLILSVAALCVSVFVSYRVLHP
uniref:Cytochrome c-552/DMSO reductase-like haem-binding domain-containing protein n=1 Tax=Medicago truncatula TaxID=3880 RepID=I3SXQ1_MEDTR|nr:unknown [Medicago truncatula]